MYTKYIRIVAMLMALCLLTACAGPTEEPAAAAPAELVTEESCTSEVPEETEPAAENDYYIKTPEQAEAAVRLELDRMKELGLLSDRVSIKDGPAEHCVLIEDEDMLDRAGRPVYSVRWYGDSWYGNNWEGENRYTVAASIDVYTGKIMLLSIEAAADENAPVAYEVPMTEYDEESGREIELEEKWLYHENFSDIFSEDMTLNHFCDLLNEYWGFDGWTLGGGGALNTAVPLRDITGGTRGGYYVLFDYAGDQDGKYMYVELVEFPGRVCLVAGTSHMQG